MSAPGTKQTYESGAVLSAQQHNKDVPGMKGPLTWAEAHHASLSDLWLRTTPRAKFSTDVSPGLALMLTLIEGLRLRQIAARILHELALGVRAAEAVGLALDRRIDGAIRLHVLVIGETPGTHVAELAVQRIGRTGKADDEDAGYEILFHFGRSFRFGRPPVT